jgi:hypothetical protein
MVGKKGHIPRRAWEYLEDGAIDATKFEVRPEGMREEEDEELEIQEGDSETAGANSDSRSSGGNSQNSNSNSQNSNSQNTNNEDTSLHNAALRFVEAELFKGKLDPFDGGSAYTDAWDRKFGLR